LLFRHFTAVNPRPEFVEGDSYLGRGVRTIQRYEVQLALPIHRPAAKQRSAVLAFADELDQWLRSTPSRNGTHSNPTNAKFSSGPDICEIQLKHDLGSELKRAEQDVKRVHAEYQRALELYDALKRQIEAAKDSSRKRKHDIQKRNPDEKHFTTALE
jgi:hypothetical protein